MRAPSRIDRELSAPFALAGGPNFVSEMATVYELRYRTQLIAALTASITAYHHDFDRLRSFEPAAAGPLFDNKIEGTLNGIETWVAYRIMDSWRIKGGFVKRRNQLRVKPGGVALGGISGLGNDPDSWSTLGSTFDLGAVLELDLSARRIGALPNPAAPAYTAVDARIGWRSRPNFELSLTAANLFDPRHAEWGVLPGRAELERSLFVKLLWRM